MSRDDPQMKIRLPEDLKARIEDVAKQAGRSMNAEILARLEKSFQTSDAQPDLKAVIEKTVEATVARLTETSNARGSFTGHRGE